MTLLQLCITFLVFVIACDNQQVKILKPSLAERAEIQKIGQDAAENLLKNLQAELLSTIENKGVSAAINICNQKALMLTRSVANSSNKVLEIKRISFKYRNPQNAPDELEQIALKHFDSLKVKDEILLEDFIQKISDESDTYFRYYKPLIIKPLCLNCHGKYQNMDNNVRQELKKLYPDDQAVGYSIGQFRGFNPDFYYFR